MQAVPLPALSGAEKRCAAAALWAAHRCTVRSSSGSSRSSTRSSGGAPLRVEWPPAGVDKAHDPKALGCRRLLPLLLVVVVVVLLLLLVLVLLPLALLAGLAVGMGLTVGGVGVLGVLVGMLAAEAEPQGSGGSRWDAACQRPWHGDTTKALAKAGRARGTHWQHAALPTERGASRAPHPLPWWCSWWCSCPSSSSLHALQSPPSSPSWWWW